MPAAEEKKPPAKGSEASSKPFEGREFPWYDNAKDQVRPMARPAPTWEGPSSAPAAAGGFGGLQLATVLIFTVAAAVLGTLLYLLLRNFRPAAVALEPVKRAEQFTRTVDAEHLPMPVEVRPDDFLSEARRLHSQGKFREAVKYLYAHQLVMLDRAHHIRLEKGKTNRQYLQDLSRTAPSGVEALVLASIESFEAAFFGSLTPTPERMDFLWRGQEQLAAALVRAPPPRR